MCWKPVAKNRVNTNAVLATMEEFISPTSKMSDRARLNPRSRSQKHVHSRRTWSKMRNNANRHEGKKVERHALDLFNTS